MHPSPLTHKKKKIIIIKEKQLMIGFQSPNLLLLFSLPH